MAWAASWTISAPPEVKRPNCSTPTAEMTSCLRARSRAPRATRPRAVPNVMGRKGRAKGRPLEAASARLASTAALSSFRTPMRVPLPRALATMGGRSAERIAWTVARRASKQSGPLSAKVAKKSVV